MTSRRCVNEIGINALQTFVQSTVGRSVVVLVVASDRLVVLFEVEEKTLVNYNTTPRESTPNYLVIRSTNIVIIGVAIRFLLARELHFCSSVAESGRAEIVS